MDKGNIFRSKGKFLITAEYLVLDGARALAVPLQWGQSLKQIEHPGDYFAWESWYENNCWFSAAFHPISLDIIRSTDIAKAEYLRKIIAAAVKLSGRTAVPEGVKIITELDFDINWGMGSSSSLFSNLAYFFDIDPFDLHWQLSAGSAYDIACARSDTPVIYQLENRIPIITGTSFHPAFSNGLSFVYSGKKQGSGEGIEAYRKITKGKDAVIDRISRITGELIHSGDQDHFNRLIDEHEDTMSSLIDLPTLKSDRYTDFEGSMKPLGAWGGDFFMASSLLGQEYIFDYFSRYGHEIIFSWDELIVHSKETQ